MKYLKKVRLAFLLLVLACLLTYAAMFRSSRSPAYPQGQFSDILFSTAVLVAVVYAVTQIARSFFGRSQDK